MALSDDGSTRVIVFADPASRLHAPHSFFRRGKTIAHPEQVERFDRLRQACVEAGHDLRLPSAFDPAILKDVHAPDYVAFLETAWARRGEIDADAEELITTQFARPQMQRRPSSLAGQLGFYTADTSTPIRAGTWEAACAGAASAAAAADASLVHGFAYALSRPPGHHAFSACADGFCYLNNTAVAAQRLRTAGVARVAVLDIDVHHGNGTQEIFYRRGDVLTVSIHADTNAYFPYFCGYADERGEDQGRGFNLNIPLPHDVGDPNMLTAVNAALERIAAFEPQALVIALGLDAASEDPLGVLDVSTEGFRRVAQRVAQRGWPTVMVQEGGYLCDALPKNLAAFLDAFETAAPALQV